MLLAASAALAQPAAFAERYSPAPASADGIGKRYMGREISAVMGLQGAAWLEREARDREERTNLLMAALALQPGMVVADIGAGIGYLSRRMAPAVMPGGRVWAVDVQPEMISLLQAGAQRSGLTQIEVRLPPEFDVGRADAQVRQSSAQWAAAGVLAMDGAPLPQFADGAVLLPAGARGPAFLTGPNFRSILRYNNSTSYALAVALLAQRLADGPEVQAPWPRDLQALTRAQLLELQTALNERGFDSGTPDGLTGPATRGAIGRYQRSIGIPADGYPSLDLLQRLLAR